MEQATFSRRALIGVGVGVTAVGIAHAGRAAAEPTRVAAAGTTVRASSFGHNLTDDTKFLQAALDSGAQTVIIDRVPGGWLTGPLHLDPTSNINPAGLHVVIEPGVAVRAVPGAYKAVRVIDRTMLSISDNPHPIRITGYGASLVMNKPEYLAWIYSFPNPTSVANAEAHLVMGVTLYGAKDVTIEGLTIRDTAGDGLNVASGTAPYSQNIRFDDITVRDCFRNGMSVSSVDGLTVQGCTFLNTNGTSPQSGVDLEPNSYNTNGRLANVVFRDCLLADNVVAGMYVSPHNLNTITSEPISILAERVTIGSQVGGAPSLVVEELPDQLGGSVEFRDCLVNNSPGSGALAVLSKSGVAGPSLTLTNVAVWDEGNSFQVFEPIIIKAGLNSGAGQQQQYGGITFDDCVVITDQPQPVLHAYDQTDGNSLTNVSGVISVLDPYGAGADFGTTPHNVTLEVKAVSGANLSRVDIHAQQASVRGGENVDLIFTRHGGNLSIPLTIAYRTTGTARERYDFGGLGGVVVIPAGKSQTMLSIPTYPRWQPSDPLQRNLIVAPSAGFGYLCSPAAPASVMINS